jgi:signal transduction histidine kinase/CheY-like chemotaxis protein
MKEAARVALAALDRALKSARSEAVWVACLLLWLLGFLLDVVTPPNIRLVLAYLPSVALATWYLSVGAGAVFAAASVAARIVDQFLAQQLDVVNDAIDALLLGAVLTAFIPMLRSTRGHLAALAAQSHQLRAALLSADAANQAKRSFLVNISHEIRTPLHAITGLTHLVKSQPLSTQQSDWIGRLDVASQHLADIIEGILDISAIDAGKLELREGPIDIARVIGDVMFMVQEKAQINRVTLRSTVAVLPQGIVGDAIRIRQALLNLVTNGVKFTQDGEVHIHVDIEAQEHDWIRLRLGVADTGCGVSPEVQARLFNAFEMGDAALSRRSGGTGLGLAITRLLAENMGGTTGVRSAVGQGSDFWFTVRLAISDVPPDSRFEFEDLGALKQRVAALHANRRVLVVDDDPVNREIACHLLQLAGLSVDAASGGTSAVELASVTRYDLVLMDIQMADMDGFEATRQIRKTRLGLNMPIVAMTATALGGGQAPYSESGIDEALIKPVRPQALYRCVLKWLPT